MQDAVTKRAVYKAFLFLNNGPVIKFYPLNWTSIYPHFMINVASSDEMCKTQYQPPFFNVCSSRGPLGETRRGGVGGGGGGGVGDGGEGGDGPFLVSGPLGHNIQDGGWFGGMHQ